MANYHGQRLIPVENIGDIKPISDEINSVVGDTATLIEKPEGNFVALVLMSDNGSFRVRLGDKTAEMPATEFPAASVSDGTSGLLLGPGWWTTLPAPSAVTVKGYAADSVLTYYWI